MISSGQLSSFSPDSDALLRGLAPHVTDRMLAHIAALDYGRDADQHAAALKQIRDKLEFPKIPQWYPDEVLLLALGGGFPDYAGSSTELSAAEQDVCMGFVAACLLKRLGDPQNERHADWLLRASGHLASLSCRSPDWPIPETAGLFAWLLPKIPDHYDQRPFLAVGLIQMAIEGHLDVAADTLEALADWIFAEEDRLLEDLDPGSGTLYRHHQPKIWRTVGRRLSEHELVHLPTRVRSKIQEIADLLA